MVIYVDKVREYLLKKIKLNDHDVIVLGNSGGPDSMCLLNILLEIRKIKNIQIICAHVNHNVRSESAKEEKFLKEYCDKVHVLFESMTIEKYGDDNFHNQARKIRYNFFNNLVEKYEANYLMTAHHGDDLIETILMRISRGSTLKGYSGFEKEIPFDSYSLVRPLIFVTKEEILTYNEKNKVPYVIDHSNFKGKYTRNRYRKEVLPFLKNEDQKIHQKYLKFSETLEEYDNFINNEIIKKVQKIYKNNVLDLLEFLKLDEFLQKKILYFLLESIYKEDLLVISDVHVSAIRKLIESKRANAFVCLPHEIKAVKSYQKLSFIQEIKDISNYEIELSKFVQLPNKHTLEFVSSCESNDNNVCRISSEEVVLPLYVRTRRLGDKMMLKRIDGYKKLKDIFIDCKVPIMERDSWPVVVDSKEKIIWIPGLKKSKFTKQKNEKYDIIIKYN